VLVVMEISDKRIKEFQEIFKKEYGKELSWEEASESARSLLGLAEIAYEQFRREHFLKEKLKDSPKGFHFDDGGIYTCPICRQHISNEQVWYDKNGLKCLHCQMALDKKIIPGSVCKRDGSWYSDWEFDYYFGIKTPTLRKFVRQGKIKSRIIPNLQGGKHIEIFLIKDNPGILPQKPESFLVKDESNMVHVEYKPVTLPDFMEEVRKKKSEKSE
jgi:hypothetical protein